MMHDLVSGRVSGRNALEDIPEGLTLLPVSVDISVSETSVADLEGIGRVD
jgi:hypothetical protein